MPLLYPDSASARSRWIVEQRPEREALDPWKPQAFFVENECAHDGEIVPVATLFLTNRECPWRCVMCDLWKHTLTETVPSGAIASQIDYALRRLPPAQHIKLYNSGSFFDPRAIPVSDHEAIAALIHPFERLIVECHPALVNRQCIRFRDLLADRRLEIAMGLETVHADVLARLNKGMTLEQFSRAAEFLRNNDIDLRAFILVQPPFMELKEALHWAERSLDFAFDCGATAATLIPTRAGNGALEQLAAQGSFQPPTFETLEQAVAYGLHLQRGRVFSDLWAVRSLSLCPSCADARIARLSAMNLRQCVLPPIACAACGANH